MSAVRQDLTRTTLAVIFIFALIAASFWVLRPFLAATVWATMLVVATWPLLKSLEARFGGRRGPAVAVMTLGMLLLLILPLWGAIETIADHADQLTDAAKKAEASDRHKSDECCRCAMCGLRAALRALEEGKP
mgnify:CR=1 FL=1